jgi:signal transduction histidine kinase
LGQSFNQMADALQEAEQLRRDMTTDIAHELRNPLAVLQGNLEAIMDGVLPPTSENLQPLLDQTRLLSRLVNDLRTLSLADAGQLSLTRLPTAAGDPVRAVLARFVAQAEAKPLRLEAAIADGLPSLTMDSMRIEQVLGNLVSNALRYTPVNGMITLTATLDGNGVLYSVEDTGIGVPADALAHLFERFYRVERSRTRTEGGSGLGLAIARQLVEAHGGRIWAENRPGGGAAFRFTIPVQ